MSRRSFLAATGTGLFVAAAGCLEQLGDGSGDDNTDEEVEIAVRNHDEFGEILTDSEGRTLYVYDEDERGASESDCEDTCAEHWPPLTVEGDPTGEDVEAELTAFERDDGSRQVAADGRPLYYSAEDEDEGDAEGYGIATRWWVLTPEGEPIEYPYACERVSDCAIENAWEYGVSREVEGSDEVVVMQTEAEVAEMIDFDEIESHHDDIRQAREAFVDETDFADSILLFVQSSGPGGYRVVLGAVQVDNAQLSVRVETVDQGGSKTATIFPTAYVRVTGLDANLEEVRVTIEDGIGEERVTTVDLE